MRVLVYSHCSTFETPRSHGSPPTGNLSSMKPFFPAHSRVLAIDIAFRPHLRSPKVLHSLALSKAFGRRLYPLLESSFEEHLDTIDLVDLIHTTYM